MSTALDDHRPQLPRSHFPKRDSTSPRLEQLRSLESEADMSGKSVIEKKLLLVDKAIDSMGMGKYQWCIWVLCGLGYMIDLLWAQAFGLVLSPMQQELGFAPNQTGNLSVAFSSGLTAGAFVWGVLVDVVGRRWAFNLTVLIASIFGLCLGIPDSYTQLLVLTAFVGFGVGGNIPIDTTICLEFIPKNKRFLLALLSLFQPLGVIVCSGIAYGFIPKYSCTPNFSEKHPLPSCYSVGSDVDCCKKADNMGWRYVLYTLGSITLLAFIARFLVFRMQESPKFYITRNHDKKAIEALDYVARFNGQANPITLQMFEDFEPSISSQSSSDSSLVGGHIGAITDDRSHIQRLIFATKSEIVRTSVLLQNPSIARLTILVWLTYVMDFWGFTVAGTYLPQILALKNGSLNLSLTYTYRSYIYIYTPGLLGVALGAFFYRVPHVGRKWTMAISSGLMGASLFAFSAVNDKASNLGFNIMEYFFQSMFNAVLYGWSPEAFPTQVRGTACGIASFWGRLAGIVSPLIAQHIYNPHNPDNVLYLAGGVTLGCVLTTSLLPSEAPGL